MKLADMYPGRRYKDLTRVECNAYHRQWSASHRDSELLRWRRYHEENRDKRRAADKKRRDENREALRARARELYASRNDEKKLRKLEWHRRWRAKNKARYLEHQRKWRAENPDKIRTYNDRKNAKYASDADFHTRQVVQASAHSATRRFKANLLDTLLPILTSGDAKALEKMRRQLVKMSKALA